MSAWMMTALAQAAADAPEVDYESPGLLSLDRVPSRDQMIDYLQELSRSDYGVIAAVLLVACGLVYLLQGWKVFKILVVVNAAILGAVVGAKLGGLARGPHTWLYAGGAGALLLAVLAWPLMKYAVSIMGALAGSVLGYAAWHYATHLLDRDQLSQHAWVGALIGLITLGLLAFVIFQLVVTVFTSVQGAVMSVGGVVSLLLRYGATRDAVEPQLRTNVYLLPLLVVVPAVIGFVFQYTASRKSGKKKPDG